MRLRSDLPPANDNGAAAPGAPHVRTPPGRPQATYACAHGLILPLRFARRMDGWGAARGDRISRNVPRRR